MAEGKESGIDGGQTDGRGTGKGGNSPIFVPLQKLIIIMYNLCCSVRQNSLAVYTVCCAVYV